MPVGEILVEDLVEPRWMLGVRDIQQDAVTRAGSGCQADLRKHGDVVALVRRAGALRTLAVRAAHPEAGDVAGGGIGEDARTIDDLRVAWPGERHLDHIDTEERGVGVVLRFASRAAVEFLGRPYR